MATVIETPSRTPVERRPYFSAIRWTAIFGGLAAGLSSYIVLALLGVAVGLTAINPQAAEPVGAVPLGTGIWSGISMLISGFIGGYVAARMSGLARSGDGLLHGFVTWSTTTLLFTVLTTSILSTVVGSTLGLAGQTIQGVGSQEGVASQLESMITGSAQGDINPDDVLALQERLQAGDRQGAVNLMVNQMGFTQDRAVQIVDNAMMLFGPQGEQQAREAAQTTVSALTAASWWLFIGLVLSFAAALWGGMLGIRPNSRRTVGDHSNERHSIEY